MNREEYDSAVDYRSMYYHMAGALETAIRILIAAQQTCEDLLLMDLPKTEQSISGTSK